MCDGDRSERIAPGTSFATRRPPEGESSQESRLHAGLVARAGQQAHTYTAC